EAELARVSGALAGAQRELQDVQGRLEAGERAASSLRACLDADCCPPGWLLYHGKCLFVSAEKKSWRQSHDDCEGRASRLLLHDERQAWALPPFLLQGSVKYWVKQRTENPARMEDRYGKYTWPWECTVVIAGIMDHSVCYGSQHWVCEQPPKLSNLSEMLSPLLARG
uniref:Uncharacterized protein n=1 Tax=Cairina moschata TaxID=8855 RepID=A0A8C3CIM3_CAIMO